MLPGSEKTWDTAEIGLQYFGFRTSSRVSAFTVSPKFLLRPLECDSQRQRRGRRRDPRTVLLQATGGNLYGITFIGCGNHSGTSPESRGVWPRSSRPCRTAGKVAASIILAPVEKLADSDTVRCATIVGTLPYGVQGIYSFGLESRVELTLPAVQRPFRGCGAASSLAKGRRRPCLTPS
jgi:hypothetical protein